MQQFYGDSPHIIDRKRKKREKKKHTIVSFRAGGLLAACAALCVTALFAAVFFASGASDTFRIKAQTWYYVSFYSPTEIVEAELSAQNVKETGGAGYIINDGVFHIAASVYDSQRDAQTVADKQTKPAAVYKLVMPEIKLETIKDKDTSERVKRGFDAYSGAFNDITDVLTQFDRGVTTESALMHAVSTVRSEIIAEREVQQAIYNETSSSAVNALCDYLESAAASLDVAVLSEKNGLSSRIRYALCEIVYQRYALASALA